VDVLLNLARAALTEGDTVAPRTFTGWCRATTLQDFRTTWRIALGAGPLLQKVPEHAEYTRGALPSRAEAIQLQTWGKILAFSRQAMVNDDLGMMARIPQMFGFSAATMEGDVVYGVLTSNPVMSDGNALFSSAHRNVGTPAVIDITSLAEARQLMRVQTRGPRARARRAGGRARVPVRRDWPRAPRGPSAGAALGVGHGRLEPPVRWAVCAQPEPVIGFAHRAGVAERGVRDGLVALRLGVVALRQAGHCERDRHGRRRSARGRADQGGVPKGP
jgi:hypothetical protein